jgi:hypothetical protein
MADRPGFGSGISVNSIGGRSVIVGVGVVAEGIGDRLELAVEPALGAVALGLALGGI